MQSNLTLSPLMPGVSEQEALARAGSPEAGKSERGESRFAGVLDREVRSGQGSGREDGGSDGSRVKEVSGHEKETAESDSQPASGEDASATSTAQDTAGASAEEAASSGRESGSVRPEEAVAETEAAASVLGGLPIVPAEDSPRETAPTASDEREAVNAPTLARALERAEALRALVRERLNAQGMDDAPEPTSEQGQGARSLEALFESLNEIADSALEAATRRIRLHYEPVRDRLSNELRELAGLAGGELPRRPLESPAGPASAPQVTLAAGGAGETRPEGGMRPAQIGLDAVFGRPGWDQALGEKVTWMIGRKLQAAEIRMNPPHLGPLEVKIQWHNDQTQIQFASHHAVVRDALEAALPRLRELMAQAGVDLGQVDVSAHSRGGDRQQEQAGQAGGEAAPASADWHPGDEEAPEVARVLPGTRLRAGLDLYA